MRIVEVEADAEELLKRPHLTSIIVGEEVIPVSMIDHAVGHTLYIKDDEPVTNGESKDN